MSVDTEYQIIPNPSETRFYVGTPCGLLGRKQHQNIIDAEILGISLEEYHKWIISRGAEKVGENVEMGFILYAFSDKKKASKVAKELTKKYLMYRMNKSKKEGN